MTMRVRGLMVCLLAMGLFGCSGSDKPQPSLSDRCVALCERLEAAECPGAPPPGDCQAGCSGLVGTAEATACTSAYAAALTCAEGNDACDNLNVDTCRAENDAWLSCVQCAPSGEDAGSEDAGSDEDAGTCN